MQNSSYAVKPELFSNEEVKIQINFIEKVTGCGRESEYIKLETNIQDFYIGFYPNKTVRLVTYNKKFDLNRSFPLEKIVPTEEYVIHENETSYTINHSDIDVVVDKNPFGLSIYRNKQLKFVQNAIGFEGDNTYLFLNRDFNDYIYGLGEKTGFLNKNNEHTVNWNSDVFEPHTRSNKQLYQSINMFTYMSKDNKYGFFLDNASKITFDFLTKEKSGVIISDMGKFDYYVYLGNSIKEIVTQHAENSGKSYLPPLWALGYHQSRHSYESIDVLMDVYNNFKEKQIPVDAIYLDILYMDEYKVFSFNKETYAGIKEVIKELSDNGVNIVPIVDPGIKVKAGYEVFEDAIKRDLCCKDKDGLVFTGDVWPGKSVFYDFMNTNVREEWGKLHQYYTDLGIEGIWNDMNEPALFNVHSKTMDLNVKHNSDGKIKTHREMHNLYGVGMSMATYEGLKKLLNNKRPFVLTRAGYAGIQKYATVWTGDNRSSWEHLEMTIPMCLNLGMSGVSISGPDIGGFMDDSTEELMIRWTQMGAFLPYFRNHSSIGIKRQEPWQFGDRCESILRKYIRLRYEIIRYVYSVVYNSHMTGLPVMRPLVLEYESDPITHSIHDQFLLGSNMLVAPIVRPGDKYRKVYLPEGIWYDFFTNKRYEGGQFIIVKAELDEIPVFVKGGTIIPTTTWKMNTKELDNNITINVYYNDVKEFENYFVIDDGSTFNYQEGKYTKVKVHFNGDKTELSFEGNGENNFNYKINKIGYNKE